MKINVFFIYVNFIVRGNDKESFLKCNVSVANVCQKVQHIRCMDTLQQEFLKQIGARIKQVRKDKGLSQSEVANRCGKERQSYQRVETGNINPTIWYLQHIATALDVELKELLNTELVKPKI